MTFARIQALGWGFMQELLSSEITQMDLNVSRSVDGFAGGTYAGALFFTNLKQLILTDITKTLEFATRTLNRILPDIGQPDSYSNWAFDGTYWSTLGTSQAFLYWAFTLPTGSTLKNVRVKTQKIGFFTHGALPVSKPFVTVRKYVWSTDVDASDGSVTDAPADVPGYETDHVIGGAAGVALTSSADPTDNTWVIVVSSEYGANAHNGMAFSRPKITVDTGRLEEVQL